MRESSDCYRSSQMFKIDYYSFIIVQSNVNCLVKWNFVEFSDYGNLKYDLLLGVPVADNFSKRLYQKPDKLRFPD